MSRDSATDQTCVIIGASHAGVNCAFALRKEGWRGAILLYDADPMIPYHRPPLSKAYLSGEGSLEKNLLRKADNYEKEGIALQLGVQVDAIRRQEKKIMLENGSTQAFDKLVIATGARPLIPNIPGIDTVSNLFALRTASDALLIRKAFHSSKNKRVVIIGGGYIGLETAASLSKSGAQVTVLEQAPRVLSRVAAPELSAFFQQLHTKNGVDVLIGKQVSSIRAGEGHDEVVCADGTSYAADVIVVGCGIRVNKELAEAAGLEIENGVRVDASARTSDENIYAIGDCTFHHNPHYDRFIRLESVQNAVDQAKIAAACMCGKASTYDSVPWFWSDQYEVKLQMVGLSAGYTEVLIRKDPADESSFSVWYFRADTLLAVDAVNDAKAYVLGTKFIKSGQLINKANLIDPSIAFKPLNLLMQ